MCIRDRMQTIASELAERNGIQLEPISHSYSDSSPIHSSGEEMISTRNGTGMTYNIENEAILEQVINMEIKSHKFAILDISQRLESSKFKDFCTCLGLHVDSVNSIEREHTLSHCIMIIFNFTQTKQQSWNK